MKYIFKYIAQYRLKLNMNYKNREHAPGFWSLIFSIIRLSYFLLPYANLQVCEKIV